MSLVTKETVVADLKKIFGLESENTISTKNITDDMIEELNSLLPALFTVFPRRPYNLTEGQEVTSALKALGVLRKTLELAAVSFENIKLNGTTGVRLKPNVNNVVKIIKNMSDEPTNQKLCHSSLLKAMCLYTANGTPVVYNNDAAAWLTEDGRSISASDLYTALDSVQIPTDFSVGQLMMRNGNMYRTLIPVLSASLPPHTPPPHVSFTSHAPTQNYDDPTEELKKLNGVSHETHNTLYCQREIMDKYYPSKMDDLLFDLCGGNYTITFKHGHVGLVKQLYSACFAARQDKYKEYLRTFQQTSFCNSEGGGV